MHAFVINLSDSRERRERIVSALEAACIPYDIVPAIDGRARNACEFEIYRDRVCRLRHGRSLTGAEVACYLSHLAALRAFASSGLDEALVLEDDAGVPADAGTRVAEVSRRISAGGLDWDAVNMAYTRRDYALTISTENGVTLRRSFYFPMIACALLWSRAGASRFLESRFGTSVCGPFDTELRSHLARSGRGLSIDPPIFSDEGHVSDIDSGVVKRMDPSLGATSRRPVVPRLARHLPDYLNAHLQKTARLIFPLLK